MKSVSSLDLDTMLKAVECLDLDDLQLFASKVNQLLARKKTSNSSDYESLLIEKIQSIRTCEVNQEYDKLLKKQEMEPLSVSEYIRLHKLTPIIELARSERMRYLTELAEIKKIAVDDLRAQLGIQ